jgi:acylphosphatase
MTVVRVRVTVSGFVQGVWFRQSCRQQAQLLGVTGWVRNRFDGRVEIEAEGARDSVDALVRWAHQGPSRAVVAGVEVEDLDPLGEKVFTVR